MTSFYVFSSQLELSDSMNNSWNRLSKLQSKICNLHSSEAIAAIVCRLMKYFASNSKETKIAKNCQFKVLHCNVSNRVQDLRVTQWPQFSFLISLPPPEFSAKSPLFRLLNVLPQQLLIVVGSSYCCVVCEKIDCSKMKSLSTFLYCHKSRTIFESVTILFTAHCPIVYSQKVYFIVHEEIFEAQNEIHFEY